MRINFHWNFSKKLFLYFAIISIVPALAIGVISYSISSRLSFLDMEKHAESTLNTAETSVVRCLNEYQSALDYFCKDKDIIDIMNTPAPQKRGNAIYQKIYIMLAGRQQTAAQMHIIKADGSFSISTSQIPKEYDVKIYGDCGIYRALKGTDKSILYSNRFISSTGQKYCVSVAHTLTENGKVLGYAIIDLPDTVFTNALMDINAVYPTDYTIFDAHYYLLYSQTDSSVFVSNTLRKQIADSSENKYFCQDSTKQLVWWNKTLGDYPITIMVSTSYGGVTESTNYIMATAISITVLTIIILLIISPLIVKNLTKPLNRIVDTMKQVQNGNTLARVSVHTKDEFGFIGKNLNKTLNKMDELYQNNLEKQDSLRVAELKALYSQINPHFLYNTLDSIKWLAKLNNTKDIVVIVSQLGHLLKYSINNCNDLIPLANEIAIAKSYVSIQKIRYGDKFDVSFEVDDRIQQYIIPKLIIQPLVENAIIHGIENKIDKAYLEIKGMQFNQSVVLEVADNGLGMSEEQLQNVRNDIEKASQNCIGLSNTNRRIKLYYGPDYGLTIDSKKDVGTTVKIKLPVIDPFSAYNKEVEENDEGHGC